MRVKRAAGDLRYRDDMKKVVTVASVVGAVALLAPAAARAKGDNPTAALRKLIDAQVGGMIGMGEEAPDAVYVDGAAFSSIGGGSDTDVGKTGAEQLADAELGPCSLHQHNIKDLRITMAGDGQSAAVAFTAWLERKCDVSGEYFDTFVRASEVAVKTAEGWRIAGGEWSSAQANAQVNAAAGKGKLPALDAVGDSDPADADLRAAFTSLVGQGLDAAAAARKDLVAIGSGPGEVTTSGAPLAKAWKAAWAGHMTVLGHPRAQVAPSGTTAWVTANVKLTKQKGATSYAIPFRLFLVFDKAGGAWSLMHAHFAVPVPSL
jgi:SnoaL-like domain